VALAGCATGRTSELTEIARLEDVREPGATRLSELAANRDPVIASRAVRALARLQDPAALPAIEAALGSSNDGVAGEGAFALMALGLSWDRLPEPVRMRAEAAALAALDGAPAARRPRLLRGLAALAGPTAARMLLVEASSDAPGADPQAVVAAAQGLGGFLRDGGAWPGGAPPAPTGAVDVRRARAWLLARAASQVSPALWSALAIAALADPDAEVRSLAARALGAEKACALPGAAAPLEQVAVADPDWRPRVEAVRALARAEACAGALARSLGAAATASAADPGPLGDQPLLALKEVAKVPVAAVPGVDAALATLERARGTASSSRRVDLARLSCQLALAADTGEGTATRVASCGGADLPPVERDRWTARALRSAVSSERDPRLAALVASPDHLTRLAALESAGFRGSPSGLTEAALLAALSGANGPEVATAATSLAKWPLPSGAGAVAAALGRFAADPDPTVPAALLDALAALAAPATEPAIRPLLASPAPALRSAAVRALLAMGLTASPSPPPLEPAPWLTATSNTGIRVESEKGAFVIALDRDDAPAHARVLSTLAGQGYFDGRAFHRVVANFVLQGGNDGDDGWGGPGFTLRCQVSPTPYVHGTVGMSLSGKDTGGAEFFVAHGAFPHLEGRYTVVGRVVQGMDVVDRILPGDRMLRVRPVP
jgi:cyclophilin family peptidyl-prolyl cis-trans isomerase/HEAT repeat protein